MTTTAQRATTTPDAILDIAIGFMGAKQLFAASRIGLFAALENGPFNAAELAEATKTPHQQVRILADAMAAQDLLVRREGKYTLSEQARDYLVPGASSLDLSPFLAFLGSISYDQWRKYDHTVDSGDAGVLELDESGWGDFMAGVMRYNEVHAQMFNRYFDSSSFQKVLDFGGLSPAFAVEAMKENAQLTTDFLVDPGFADSVSEAVAAAGLSERATVTGVDTLAAKPAGQYDLIMLNHVAHRFSAEENQQIITAARAAAAPGATLVILDFYLDSNEQQRKIDALHAGEYYNIDGTVVYPLDEVHGWLREAGFEPTELIELPGSPRLLVATAR